MLKDLRKLISKIAIKVNPSDCRNNDVHLLLSDYLYKELKNEGIDVRKNNVNVIVNFKDNTRLIVDCLDGHLYMDTKESNKPIGKLRRFNIKRAGEAYDCAVQNARRIINKIKAIQNEINNDNVIFKQASVRDMRKTADIVSERESAIVVINSSIIEEANTHSEAINNYLTTNGSDGLNDTYYRVDNNDLETPIDNLEQRLDQASNNIKPYVEDAINIKENINELAFAHKMKDFTIRLETDTLWNCNVNDVSLTLKNSYPDYDIVDYMNTNKRIADLRKSLCKISLTDMRKRKIIICDNRSNSKIIRYDARINKHIMRYDFRSK